MSSDAELKKTLEEIELQINSGNIELDSINNWFDKLFPKYHHEQENPPKAELCVKAIHELREIIYFLESIKKDIKRVRLETLKEVKEKLMKLRNLYPFLCDGCKLESKETRLVDSYCENCRKRILSLWKWLEGLK